MLDVCPLSNLRTGAVASLADHPLPRLAAAGVRCSISTDDPAMFDTDLTREFEAATAFGLDPGSFYEAGVECALLDAMGLGDEPAAMLFERDAAPRSRRRAARTSRAP